MTLLEKPRPGIYSFWIWWWYSCR